MNDTFTIPITRLKQDTAGVISDVTKKGISAVVMQRSQPKVVIADYEYFNALEEAVIDLADARDAEKRKGGPTILLEEYAKKRWGKTAL